MKDSAITPRQQPGSLLTAEYCAEDNKAEILGITGGLVVLAIIVVGLRIVVRSVMLKSVGADDFVMLLALLMAIATFICFVGESHHAVGKHSGCVTQQEMEMFLTWQYFHALWIMFGVALVKVSVAFFLMRLVPPTKHWKAFLWASIVFLLCFMIACAGTLIFACIPLAASWNFSLREKASTHCFSNDTFTLIGLTNSSINCATDFLFAILPIPVVVKLHIDRGRKIILGIILSLGYTACAAGIVKAVKQHNYFDEKDPLWHDDFMVWNMIECCVGIVAASLPSLRPLVANALERTKSSFAGGSSGSSRLFSLNLPGPDRRHGYAIHSGEDGDISLEKWEDRTGTTLSGRTGSGVSPGQSQVPLKPGISSTNAASMKSLGQRYTVCVMGGHAPPCERKNDISGAIRSQSHEISRGTIDEGITKTVDMELFRS